ncbi:uncharacterized protein LOC133804864 [Humulus lupulus]|uniref:uncharacterized protein LOC133804864 n=1 Tax=Humulus lupulus TaxID=3486 RepID=UPI002B41611A|nr:uncharacterized protein LOC133804864 [Humulus lupulus]XP_062098965.1 uncharacterized protein LOC133804864 [Humulus lupulus]
MGSLMSGWDSPVFASKSGTNKRNRNRSLTKEDIEAFWRTKNKTVEEHLKDLSDAKQHQKIEKFEEDDSGKEFHHQVRSRSVSLDNLKVDVDSDQTSIENIIKKHGWWTKSNWAFLNEPPASEDAPNTYVSQFHVARVAPSH